MVIAVRICDATIDAKPSVLVAPGTYRGVNAAFEFLDAHEVLLARRCARGAHARTRATLGAVTEEAVVTVGMEDALGNNAYIRLFVA